MNDGAIDPDETIKRGPAKCPSCYMFFDKHWRRQCGPVVRALALRSGDPGLVEFDPGSPWFNFSAALVNSQLVCLRPVGILKSCFVLFRRFVVFHWP